jgi:hypothetical protein
VIHSTYPQPLERRMAKRREQGRERTASSSSLNLGFSTFLTLGSLRLRASVSLATHTVLTTVPSNFVPEEQRERNEEKKAEGDAPKLPRLHLLLPVVLVVLVLARVDQVEHVGAEEERAKLLEVAVVLVLDYKRRGKSRSVRRSGTAGEQGGQRGKEWA